MIDLQLKRGKVVSTEGDGRIQVRPLPDMIDIKQEDLLPWAEPFIGNSTPDSIKINSLKKDSLVWLLCRDDFRDPLYYIPEYNVQAVFDFTNITNLTDSVTEIDKPTIDAVKAELLYNGNLILENLQTGESVYLHNSGSYTAYDASGNMFSYSAGTYKVYTDNGYIDITDTGQVDINGHLTIDA